MENPNVETWNQMYLEGRSLLKWPDEIVVKHLNHNKIYLKKGIDIACGAGRHTLLMAKMGIESVGIDSSEFAIKYATKIAYNKGLKNVSFYHTIVQNMSFYDENFDLAIVWGLFHYLDKKDQSYVLFKVKDLLNNDGSILCTLRSQEDSRAKKGEKVEENRFLIDYFDKETDSPKKTLMYFWDKKGVEDFFVGFKELKIGHRVIEPIGGLSNKTAHWLVVAKK